MLVARVVEAVLLMMLMSLVTLARPLACLHEMSQPTSISKPITGKRDTPGKEEREEEEGKTDRQKKW